MLNLYDYISNTQFCQKFKVNDLLFTIYDCLADESRLGIWSHHNYFAYVLSGRKVWKTTEKEFLAGPGDSLFVKKGAHVAHQIFEDDFCVLFIFISDEFIQEVIQNNQVPISESDCQEEGGSIIPLHVDEVLSSYYQSVLTYFPLSSPPPECLLLVKFKELIIDILYSKHNPVLNGYFKAISCNAKISIANIMQENFTYNLQLEEFARLCGRSLSTFKRDFRKLYGMPPGKWLTKKRLTFGKYLLETTEKDITQIALDSGFENTSHFIRIFKKKFGLPPLKHRSTAFAPAFSEA